jgi:hypothetical protein
MCPQAGKQPSLQWYGYAVDGIGFHYLELDESLMVGDATIKEHEAMLIVAENRLNADLLTQDLKALVEEYWDWQAWRISDIDFDVIFSTKDSHKHCLRIFVRTLVVLCFLLARSLSVC